MMKKITLLLFVLTSTFSWSQKSYQANLLELDTKRLEKLSKIVSEYEIATIELSDMDDYYNKDTRIKKMQFTLPSGRSFDIEMHQNDVHSFKYELYKSDQKGSVQMAKEKRINTYKGFLKDGNDVRITLKEDFIYGTIMTAKGTIVIDQLKYVLNDSSIPANQIIVYNEEKVIDMGGFCGLKDKMENKTVRVESEQVARASTSGCFRMEVAVDADFEFFQTFGGNTNTRINGYFNSIRGLYETTFDLDIVLVNTHIWTTVADPYVSFDGATINNEIENTWSTTFGSVNRDIVCHFTGKDLGALLGRANAIGNLCDGDPNNFTSNHPTAYKTLAHEIGHNLNGLHPTSGCTGSSIPVMCQGTSQRVPLYFSTNNRVRINNHLSANQGCIITTTPSIDLFIDTVEGEGSAIYVGAHVESGMPPYKWYLNGVLQSSTSSSFSKRYRCEGGSSYIDVTANTPCGTDSARKYFYEDCTGGESHRMVVSPNPSSSIIYISEPLDEGLGSLVESSDLRTFNENLLLELYNFNGTLVKTKKDQRNTELSLDVSSLKKGNYFLRIHGKELDETHQIIIE